MRFVYHPDLVEQVVFLITRRDAAKECALHELTDRLYAITDLETRNAAFRKTFADCFTEWKLGQGMEWQIHGLIDGSSIDRCVLAPACSGNKPHIDLLVKNQAGRNERTLLVQITPDSILEPASLVPWMRSELLQVADMLDENFGYQPDDIIGSPWERRLRQDRYMVLWRVYVAGRLLRQGHQIPKEMAALRAAFDKVFLHLGAQAPPQSFARVLGAGALTHAQLLAWAVDPTLLLFDKPTQSTGGPCPGGLCPLCGFPTHDWYDSRAAPAGSGMTTIRSAYPLWHVDQGACRQCVETYTYRIGGNGLSTNRIEGAADALIPTANTAWISQTS